MFISVINLKRACYSKYASLRFKMVGMQPIDELYQFISNHKTHLVSPLY